ncbi:MAG: pyrroline-5-carboxylate reductase [Clostridia bacterium]|nr:pyrroline-5-carboxylate reductase [Clostridia bacterium]
MKTLGFVGAGNMGSALIRGLITAGAIESENVYVCGHHPEALKAFQAEMHFNISEDIPSLIEKCDAILFAVKPYHIEKVLEGCKDALRGKIMLSVINGYDFDRYKALLHPDTPHLFIMPNTPCSVGEGVFMFESRHSLPENEHKQIEEMFSKAGSVFHLPSHLMAAGAAVAGCGPAFIAMVLEALSDAAVKYGIPRVLSYKLASQTALGCAKLQLETGMHPGVIKDGVCSPAGTTIRGVQALEKAGMRSAFMDAVDAVMGK